MTCIGSSAVPRSARSCRSRCSGARNASRSRSPCASRPPSARLLAQAREIAAGGGREALTRHAARPRRVDEVLERPGEQQLADARMARGRARHLVEEGEAAADGALAGAVVFDDAGEVLPEARVEKVVVLSGLEAHLGEELREVALEVGVQLLEGAGGITDPRHCARPHLVWAPR